ncbi:MAG: transcriptional regulator [Candidatus Heimdallarchaeota archaeon]|nr:transcriptional regulator [Candidatus Heimdallarchaeota archaeon]
MSENNDDLREIIQLSDVIHTPARLAILMFLSPRPNAIFPEVKMALKLTSGNLSSHISKLSNAGYIYVEKKFVDSKPMTVLSITAQGLSALAEYADLLQRTLTRVTEG